MALTWSDLLDLTVDFLQTEVDGKGWVTTNTVVDMIHEALADERCHKLNGTINLSALCRKTKLTRTQAENWLAAMERVGLLPSQPPAQEP